MNPAVQSLSEIVAIQFMEPSSPWTKFAPYMEVNVHQMVNGGYDVTRVFWTFDPKDPQICNEFLRTAYRRIGTQFHCMFVLMALDHKQEVSGTIRDIDVMVDRDPRGLVHVLVDLDNAKTKQFSSGELASIKEPVKLVDRLIQEHEDESNFAAA